MTASIFYVDAPDQSASFVVCDSFDGETMTAAFTQRDAYSIEAQAWREFKVAPLAAGVLKESRAQRQKRARISETVASGLEVLESNSPPQSRDEAIRRIVGAVAMALAFFFPQYRLAIQVAGWLWDYLHGDPSATTSGDS